MCGADDVKDIKGVRTAMKEQMGLGWRTNSVWGTLMDTKAGQINTGEGKDGRR